MMLQAQNEKGVRLVALSPTHHRAVHVMKNDCLHATKVVDPAYSRADIYRVCRSTAGKRDSNVSPKTHRIIREPAIHRQRRTTGGTRISAGRCPPSSI